MTGLCTATAGIRLLSTQSAAEPSQAEPRTDRSEEAAGGDPTERRVILRLARNLMCYVVLLSKRLRSMETRGIFRDAKYMLRRILHVTRKLKLIRRSMIRAINLPMSQLLL